MAAHGGSQMVDVCEGAILGGLSSPTIIQGPAGPVGPPGPVGPAGPQGPPGLDGLTYEHSQPTAATIWTVNHNFGQFPSVQVRSLGGIVVGATVIHLSENVLQIHFIDPFAGFARCT